MLQQNLFFDVIRMSLKYLETYIIKNANVICNVSLFPKAFWTLSLEFQEISTDVINVFKNVTITFELNIKRFGDVIVMLAI